MIISLGDVFQGPQGRRSDDPKFSIVRLRFEVGEYVVARNGRWMFCDHPRNVPHCRLLFSWAPGERLRAYSDDLGSDGWFEEARPLGDDRFAIVGFRVIGSATLDAAARAAGRHRREAVVALVDYVVEIVD